MQGLRSAVSACAVAVLGAASGACRERPGPEMTLEDVTSERNSDSCVVADDAPDAPRTWIVRPGDTLAAIARKTYGDELLWREIARANGLGERAVLTPGTVLVLPPPPR